MELNALYQVRAICDELVVDAIVKFEVSEERERFYRIANNYSPEGIHVVKENKLEQVRLTMFLANSPVELQNITSIMATVSTYVVALHRIYTWVTNAENVANDITPFILNR